MKNKTILRALQEIKAEDSKPLQRKPLVTAGPRTILDMIPGHENGEMVEFKSSFDWVRP
jgi:hypothetical protein